eukprot:Nk52_evm26s158 gene=Nk52_evmTU26s158
MVDLGSGLSNSRLRTVDSHGGGLRGKLKEVNDLAHEASRASVLPPPCELSGGELPSYDRVVEAIEDRELPPRYVPVQSSSVGEEERCCDSEPVRRATILYEKQLAYMNSHVKLTKKGFHCTDAAIKTVEDIENYFQSYSVKPNVKLIIRGYHYKYQENNLKKRSLICTTTTSPDEREIEDFYFEEDITSLIKGDGKIAIDDGQGMKRPSVPYMKTSKREANQCPRVKEVFEEYLESNATVKDIKMYRKILWRMEFVRDALRSIARYAGYPFHLDVSLDISSRRVSMSNDNKAAAALLKMSNTKAKVAATASVLGLFVFPVLRECMRKSWSCLTCEYELCLGECEAIEIYADKLFSLIDNWKSSTAVGRLCVHKMNRQREMVLANS